MNTDEGRLETSAFICGHVLRIAITVLAGGLLGATLARVAPGYGLTDQDWDSRLSAETVAKAHARRAADPGLLRFYAEYLRGLAHGDLGWSTSLDCPVTDLVRARLPLSMATLARGVSAAVAAGIAAAFLAMRWRALAFMPGTLAMLCVSVPAAVFALLMLIQGWPGTWALAFAVFPHVYTYTRNLMADAAAAPHVMAAHARGIRPSRVILNHVLRTAAPQILAVAGLAVAIGFPALVPIEVVCDSPGILQLAWKAALSRDVPVLVNVTLLAAVIVMIGNAASDVLSRAARRAAQ
jgi:peptide/nickel transport system permease protein